jgi:hypothetical protein
MILMVDPALLLSSTVCGRTKSSRKFVEATC